LRKPPTSADQQRQSDDLDEGARERVGNAPMQLEELRTGPGQADQQLGPVRGVRCDDAD